jgi:hypothetical protein
MLFVALPAEAGAGQRKAPTSLRVCGETIPVTDASCRKEFDEWQAREKDWRKNRQQYANYVMYLGRMVYESRPEAPSWVAAYCAPGSEGESANRWTTVCVAYEDYVRYDWTRNIEGPPVPVTFSTRVQSSQRGDNRGFVQYLLKNIHYDGPWTNSATGARIYGVFGTHMTLPHVGRLSIWGPPGVLVVRGPSGSMDVKMSWGIDVFVAEIPIGEQYRLPLYVSIAKVFGTNSGQSTANAVNTGMNMIGLSFTIKR